MASHCTLSLGCLLCPLPVRLHDGGGGAPAGLGVPFQTQGMVWCVCVGCVCMLGAVWCVCAVCLCVCCGGSVWWLCVCVYCVCVSVCLCGVRRDGLGATLHPGPARARFQPGARPPLPFLSAAFPGGERSCRAWLLWPRNCRSGAGRTCHLPGWPALLLGSPLRPSEGSRT